MIAEIVELFCAFGVVVALLLEYYVYTANNESNAHTCTKKNFCWGHRADDACPG